MVKKQNIKANFWIRLLSTLIDLFIFVIFSVGTSFLIFNYKKADFLLNNIVYKEVVYRIWLLGLILFNIFEFIVIPIITGGQTVGMLICKIKIIANDNDRKLSRFIFDRQRLFSFLWVFIFLSFMLMSTDAFLKAARGQKMNTVEKLVVSLPTVLATIAINLQIFMILTGVVATRLNWNDKFSRTKTVWKNKFEEVFEDEDYKLKIYPKKRELPKIEILN